MNTPNPPAASAIPRALSLRSLLILVALMSCVLASVGGQRMETRRQNEAISSLLRLNGRVWYEKPSSWIKAAWNEKVLGGSPLGAVTGLCVAANGERLDKTILGELGSFNQLQFLTLCGRQVTDADLRGLNGCTALRILFLEDNPITGSGLGSVARLPSLRRLYLDNCPVANQWLRLLEGTQLDRLSLSGTKVDNAGLSQLGRLDQLAELDLDRTMISNVPLNDLLRFPTLRRLSLRGTATSDEGLKVLRGLPRIEYLDLRNTMVTDAGLGYLEQIPSLRQVVVGGSHVSERATRRLWDVLNAR